MDILFKEPIQEYTFYNQIVKFLVLSLVTSTAFFSFAKLLKPVANFTLIPQLPSVPIFGALYPLLWQNPNNLFLSWVSKYGSTFRTSIMGKDIVLLNNLKWVQTLLTSSDPGHLPKYPVLYNLVFPNVLRDGLISQSNIPIWKHHRSILSKAFSLESLKANLKVLNRRANLLIDKMNIRFEDKADYTGCAKNYSLHAMLRESTYHSTGELFGGLENLSKEEQLGLETKFYRYQDIMSYRLYHPWCLSKFIWKYFPERKEMDELENSMLSTFKNLVTMAKENLDTKKSMKTLIDFMIEGGLDNDEMISELGNFAIGAYDTETHGLNIFLFVMALHPNYQTECRKEIDKIFESQSNKCDDVNDELSWEDLAQMKYLEMCIKESLRMFTPIPAFARELTGPLKLEENLVLDKGTVVFVSPALIHRDPEIYPDPNIYNPDRFLPDNCKARSAYSYLAFSKGARDCIGQRLAMMHMKLIVAYILRFYELYSGNPDDNLSKVWKGVIWPTRDLGVRWTKRTQV